MTSFSAIQAPDSSNIQELVTKYQDESSTLGDVAKQVAVQLGGSDPKTSKEYTAYRKLFTSSEFQQQPGASVFLKQLGISLRGENTGAALSFLRNLPAPKSAGFRVGGAQKAGNPLAKLPKGLGDILKSKQELFSVPAQVAHKAGGSDLDRATRNCGNTAGLVVNGLEGTRKTAEVPRSELLAALSQPATEHEVWDITVHQHTFTLERFPGDEGGQNQLIQSYQPGYNVQHWMGMDDAICEKGLEDLPEQWRQPTDSMVKQLVTTIDDLYSAPARISLKSLAYETGLGEEFLAASFVPLGIQDSRMISSEELERMHKYLSAHTFSSPDVDKGLEVLKGIDVSKFNSQRSVLWQQLPFNPTDPFIDSDNPAFTVNRFTFDEPREFGASVHALESSMQKLSKK